MKRAIIVGSALGVVVVAVWWIVRGGPIDASGGEPFDVMLPAQSYLQNDPRWRDDRIGRTSQAFGAVGCTVTAVAMGLSTFGIEITPGALNTRLTEAGGYDANGRLKWATIEALFGTVAVDWERPLAHATLDAALHDGEPIVTRITLPSGLEHWVLVVGKRGSEYYARDPLVAGVVALSSYGSPIRAVRVLCLTEDPGTTPSGRARCRR